MNFWTFMFFAMIFAIPLSAIWTAHLRKSGASLRRHARDVDAVNDELARLRERVKVLEEIVTDRRFTLSREIDALERNGWRDGPAR